MSVPQGYMRVDVPFDHRAAMFAVDQWAFAAAWPTGMAEHFDHILDWDRARAVAVEDPAHGEPGELAGVHGSFAYAMRVPGGATVPTSGLTWVGVHPAHRRRGILRSMIDDHFARSLARGEVVSTLIAAETEIYQRFGYGLATRVLQVSLGSGVKMREMPGADALRVRLEDCDPGKHGPAIRAVLARDPRPGTMAEISDPLLRDLFVDPDMEWQGADKKRIAIVEDDAGPAAFAIFRRKLDWGDTGADGKADTSAWAVATPLAGQRLWAVLTSFDLIAKTKVVNISADDPLTHQVHDVRALAARYSDHLWARILDVPRALETRAYLADVDAVVAVTDPQLADNAHSWRIAIADGTARVTRAERDAPVDAEMSIQELSAAYLGGTRLDELARAGLVLEHRPGVVDALGDAFRSRLAPRSSFYF